MYTWTKRALLLLPLVLVIAGCNPATPTPLGGPAAEALATSVPQVFPAGVYVNGDWSGEFKPDGTFVLTGPQGNETGTYVVNQDKVSVKSQSCGDVEGTYNWCTEGAELYFDLGKDQCPFRDGILNGTTWTKK